MPVEMLPVAGDVLKWARKSYGLTIDDVVLKMKRKRVTAETVRAWESGEYSPTFPQLERLAYDIYKRPLAVFFFPSPPEEDTVSQSFRTLPDYEIGILPQRIRMFLRKAQAFQLNLSELYDGANPAGKLILADISLNPETPVSVAAKDVREYLGVSIADQRSFGGTEDALKAWRKVLEDVGIHVFKGAFQADDFSGFCSYDAKYPVIYVNNSKPFSRQIFTLFHELAHLLLGTGGVDTPVEGYIDHLHGNAKRVEILCNKFAGEFLIPDAEFEKAIAGIRVNDDSICSLASTYHVSREVILRKLLDRNRIDQTYYNERVKAWKLGARRGGAGGDGNYYLTQRAYLGMKYMDKAFSQYYQNRIPVERLADYLGVKVNSIPGMEALLYPKHDHA